MAGGRGCGVRGQASQACLREAPGSRPSLLRVTALRWAGRGADEGGRKPAGSGARLGPRPRPEVTAPGTEKPLWSAERRPRSRQWSAARPKTGAPLGAPPLDFSRGTKKAPRNGREDGLPGAAKNTGDDAWLVAPKRSEGGLFEN